MDFFRRLCEALGIDPNQPSKPKREFSVLSASLQTDGGVSTALCDVHQTTFPIPNATILSFEKGAIVLDTGGYCTICQKYRCPECSIVLEILLHGKTAWTPGCKICRTPYSEALLTDS